VNTSAARPPAGARAPSGGSDPHAVGERGGTPSMIPKVLVTKIGFDGHDRGSRVVAAGLRDAGMEVIYTPPWQEIAAVVKLALEEDVDVIGISSLATDHLIVPRLMDALREAGLGDAGVIVGGIVPDGEEQALLAAGVARVFHPGSAMADIAAYVRELAQQVRARRVAA
jgi:methylmalonyl-CoA mutase, C-terminal domain